MLRFNIRTYSMERFTEGEPELTPQEKQDATELLFRIYAYISRAAELEPGTFGSIEWLHGVAQFWRKAREYAELTIEQVAEVAGVGKSEVLFLEMGLFDPSVVCGGLGERYAEAVGKPDLYKEFYDKFRISEIIPYSDRPT